MPVDTAQFEQARARIQQLVREIAATSRTSIPLPEYFPQFLDKVIRSIDAQGGAIWLLANNDLQLFCDVRLGDIEFESNPTQKQGVLRALKDVIENKRPLVVSPIGPDIFPQSVSSVAGTAVDEPGIFNQTRFPLFYVPLMVDHQAVGVLHIWQKAHRDPKASQEFITFLTSVSTYAESYLKSRKMADLAREVQQMQRLLQLSNALAGQLDESQIATLAVNHAREILGCDRCAVVTKRREKWSVVSVSAVAQPQKKSQLVKLMAELAASIPDGAAKMFCRGDSQRTSGEADAYFSESNLSSVLALPIQGKDGPRIGTFLAESVIDKPWPETLQRTAALIIDPLARSLVTAREYRDLPMLPVMKAAQKTKTVLLGPQRNRALAKVGIPVALLLAFIFMPWKLRVEGDATVLPSARAVAPAEIGGRIVEVFVREGDDVRAGQTLAKIDDTRIKLDLAVARQEKARWETEAGRQAATGDEGQRRVAELQADLATHEIARLEHDLVLTELKSPIDGRVVSKDLHLKVGQVLQQGEGFAEITNLDRWEVVINVRESDVSQIEEQLRDGQEVPVDFLLYSHSTDKKQAVVRELWKIGQLSTAADRHNVYQITADVITTGHLAREFKPGYTGRAKLDAGWHTAGYVFTRRFLNFVRVEWLF